MARGRRSILAALAAAGVATMGAFQSIVPAAASGTVTINDFSQCANGSPGTVTTPPNGCVSWINGDLNAQNSQYHEDQVVPQRLELTLGKNNTASDHTVTLQYLDRKGAANAHAYDSLATYNFTVNADRCQALANCPGGTANTFPIPADPTTVPPIGSGGNGSAVVSAHQLPNQVFTMYGGTITSTGPYVHTAAASPGTDDNVNIQIHYTAAAGATVELLFGGHLAAETGPRGWGTGLGSANINGGPYHISLTEADGASVGSKDNNIQSSAILAQAALSITKTADSGTVNAGSPVGFTITVTNSGGAPASGVTVTDNLPNTGSAWTMSPTVSGCTISGATATQVLNCTLTVPANGAVSIHVVSIAANPAACGTLTNTATFSGGGMSGSAGPVSVTVTCPALKVVKTPDAASVSSGQAIGFTVTVSNTGNGTATGVTLNDPLPGGTGVNWSINTQPSQGSCSIGGTPPSQTLTCSLGNIAAGGSVSLHIISQTTAQTSGTFTNTATAQATNSPPASGTGSETVLPPSLSVTKRPDAASVSAGSPIGFTITVTNGGSGTALGATLNDPLPTGTGLNWSISPAYTGPGTCSISGTAPAQQTLSCSFGNLAPGATLSVHVTSPTTSGTSGTFTNTATAQATNNPPTTGTGSTTVNQPGLHVTKTPDAPSVSSGSPIGFTITTSNTATAGTATAVTLHDPLPTGTGLNWSISPAYTGPGTCSITGTAPAQQTLNCSFGDLAPGASVSVHVMSPTTAGTSGTFTNTATAQGTNTPPTSGTGSTTVNQPGLHVTKTPDAASVSSGQPIGFTITVNNSGTGTATMVTLNDPLPGGTGVNWSINTQPAQGSCSIGGTPPSQTLTCAFGDLGPGVSVSLHVISQTTAQTSGTFNNTATAQGSNTPPTSGSGSTTVLSPNLSVTKTPDAASVSSGQPIGFTITVTNNGTGTALGATLTDSLPVATGLNWSINPAYTGPGTCSISGTAPAQQTLNCSFGNLTAGATLSVHVSSPTTAQTSGTITNTAVAQATNNPPTSGTGSTTVNPPGLKVTKTPDAASVSSGQPIGFTIKVTNTGTGTATGATLTDSLPLATGLNWSISPAYTGPGTCSISGTAPAQQTLNCSFGDLAPGATVTVHVSSPTTAQTSGTISNTAVAQATNNPPTTGTGTTTVNQPNLAVTKTPDAAQVSSGSPIGFTITVHNGGTGTATGATLNDPLPTGTGLNWSINPAYTGPGTCSISGTAPAQQTLTCSFGDLAPGATVSVHVVSPTTSQTSGTFTNTAVAQATNNPPTSGTGTTTVNQPALHVTKTPDAAQVSSGTPIGFTITVSNTASAGTATAVTLNDPLPTGTGLNWSISPAYTGPGTCSISGSAPAQQTLTCSFGDLAPGASVSVHVVSPTTAGTSGTFTNTATAQGTNTPPTSGTGSTTVNQPQLVVTKTPDAAQVSSGTPIGFTITVSNTAAAGTATSVTLNDPLPTGTGLNWSISPAYTGPGTCSISGTAPAQQTLTCSFGDLAPGASVSVHVMSPTTAGTSGTFTNTATAQGTNTPPTSGTGSTTVLQPNLTISKTADQSSVSAGTPIGFTIVVGNSGPGTATNVTVTDALPDNPGLNWSLDSVTPTPTPPDGCAITGSAPQVLNCSFASLAPGQSFTIHVTSPTTSATCGAAVNNTATVNAGNATGGTTSQTATITVNCPDVHVTKTADSGTVTVGSQIGFTITVTNMGAGTATNVTVTDTLPNQTGLSWSIASVTPALTGTDQCSISATNPQVLTCNFATLAPNASEAIHIVSPTGPGDCGVISNVASQTTGNDGSSTSGTPTTINVQCAVLNVSKVACPVSTVPSGGLLTYTITFSNSGTAPASNTMLVDTIPAGTSVANAGGGTVSGGTVTWNLGTLAPKSSGSETLILLVTAANGTTLTNSVTISSSTATASATSTATVTVSNAGAVTHGSAYGLEVNAAGIEIVNKFGLINTVQPGGPAVAASNLAVVPVPDIVTIKLVTQASKSVILNSAESTASSDVATLNLLDGAITADAVQGVSQSVAFPTTATYNSNGSNFANLVVLEAHGPVALGTVAPNTSVVAYNPLAPKQQLANVELYEESGTAGLSSGLWHSQHSVNMIHVTLLAPFGTLKAGAEIIVAHAATDATYPSGLACGTQPNTVSGKAFTVFANGTVGNTTVVNAQFGDAELPPTGGSNSDGVATVGVPGIVAALAGTNNTSGSTSPNPNATSSSVVHSVNVLGGLVTADLIDVNSTSSATGKTANTTFGSTCGVDACATGCSSTSPCFVNLAVGGTSIVGINGGTITPNTTIAIPQPDGSLVLVILNEQTRSTDGTKNTSGTINAIDVFVLNNSGIVTVHVIVASAESDAHHS